VRRHYDYIERNPHYRRELINSIGLPAVQAAPPHQMSPRAVTTSAYWEARDLAAAGLVPPPRGRDTGRNWQAGTVVDTREAPSNVVEPGAPAPGFNAPFPDGRYGAGEGRAKPDRPMARDSAAPPQFDEPTFTPPAQKPDDPTLGIPSVEAGRGSRGRDDGRLDAPRPKPDGWVRPDEPRYEPAPRDESRYQSAPREEPKFEPPVVEKPRYEPAPREEPRYEPPQREEPRYDPPPPREEPKHDPPPPREEPKYDPPPREEPKDDREPE
jgi:hypothetical protein